MTEQQVDKKIARIDRWLWLKTLWLSLFEQADDYYYGTSRALRPSGDAPGCGCLALLIGIVTVGLIVGLRYWFGLVVSVLWNICLLFFAVQVVCLLWAFLGHVLQPRAIRIWKFFVRKYVRSGLIHELDKTTEEKISDRVLKLYESEYGRRIFPPRKAAQLFNAHYKESIALANTTQSLDGYRYDYENLLKELNELQELGEGHRKGNRGLNKRATQVTQLTIVKSGLEQSMSRLGIILTDIEKEVRKKILHDKINRHAEDILNEPSFGKQFEAEVLQQLEERLTLELKICLQLDEEARRYFDQRED